MYRALNEASSDVTFDQMYDMAKGVANVATGLKKGSKASEYSYSSVFNHNPDRPKKLHQKW